MCFYCRAPPLHAECRGFESLIAHFLCEFDEATGRYIWRRRSRLLASTVATPAVFRSRLRIPAWTSKGGGDTWTRLKSQLTGRHGFRRTECLHASASLPRDHLRKLLDRPAEPGCVSCRASADHPRMVGYATRELRALPLPVGSGRVSSRRSSSLLQAMTLLETTAEALALAKELTQAAALVSVPYFSRCRLPMSEPSCYKNGYSDRVPHSNDSVSSAPRPNPERRPR
jgi:hypothetical protein